MGYDYYCAHCGKQLNQNTVLFDMQYLLTRDDTRQFQILKYRLTLAELSALLASGVAGEHGYKICRLTMPQIMACISNANNLNDSNIATLTLDQIRDYLNAAPETGSGKTQDHMDDYDDYGDDEEEEDLSAETTAPYIKPPAIVVLENRSKALVDELFIRDMLSKDLSVLLGLFGEGDVFEIQLREENDEDNDGNPVLVGYSLKSVGGALQIQARVCGECGTPVFEHAGTARHQAVAFIGSPKAGKTSTILALSHYATYYMDNGFGGGKVWEGCQVIDSVASVEMLDKTERVKTDLANYGQGIAPSKTNAEKREDAYSVTLRLSNKAEGKKRYLLTLVDLPGELCVEDGKVQWAKVQNLFPVALNCDAFVMCFDTQSLAGKNAIQSPAALVADVCNWADQFQKMRAQHNGLDTYVPTMVLFTKCTELEDPNAPVLPVKPMLPLDRMYLLRNEKQQIAENKMYQFVSERFSNYGQLDKAYHAMMRCSPFGYDAPDGVTVSTAQKEGRSVSVEIPSPKNIDYLMRWLLSVTGCILTEASFARTQNDIPYKLQNFCISRPQLRSENPGVSGKVGDVEESMARCALFENPGHFDREYVAKHDKGKFVLAPLQLDDKMHPNTNAR